MERREAVGIDPVRLEVPIELDRVEHQFPGFSGKTQDVVDADRDSQVRDDLEIVDDELILDPAAQYLPPEFLVAVLDAESRAQQSDVEQFPEA